MAPTSSPPSKFPRHSAEIPKIRSAQILETTIMKGSGMFNLKIGARIYAGFAVILALLCLMSAIGVVSIMNDSATLTQYSNTASNALRTASIDTDFISMRRQVLLFSASGDQKIAARVRE